ncbi:hypothetical protein SteCoe_30954 [Stentor coeruleus]|uniref:Uncharacterized protein n=1 Tax=Stentor coeruleus TaxID=5963 RepID=A0A1R2B2H9_9CILI|nr:hypothetical protein SteCoe_30954 [Stentor coeruleus]
METHLESSHLVHSSGSFNLVSEEITNEIEKLMKKKSDYTSSIEELSSIPRNETLNELKASNSLLGQKISSQLSDLKHLRNFLSHSDLDAFIKIEEFIKTVEESESTNVEVCAETDYVDYVRKQQEMMMKLLNRISSLQWEVEQGYGRIKDSEEVIRSASILSQAQECYLETPHPSRTQQCFCEIM